MEPIPLDLSLYLDDSMSVIKSEYVRMMTLATGYESYVFYGSQVGYTDLEDKDYSKILSILSRSKYNTISYVLLIYTIVRFLYPNRPTGIFYNKNQNQIQLCWLEYNWYSQIPKGYIPICTRSDLLKYMSLSTDQNPVSKYNEIVDRIPEIEGRVKDLASTDSDTLFLPYTMSVDMIIDDNEQLWLEESMALYRNKHSYSKIMNDLPPYNCIDKKRRYTYGGDTNFLFQ
jgi:hypothetical protein